MMVRSGGWASSAGVVGRQNWVQLDSFIAIALSSSQGKTAGTMRGAAQPAVRSATVGPFAPHAAGPPATSAKIGCQPAIVGLVPLMASTPQLPVLEGDES